MCAHKPKNETPRTTLCTVLGHLLVGYVFSSTERINLKKIRTDLFADMPPAEIHTAFRLDGTVTAVNDDITLSFIVPTEFIPPSAKLRIGASTAARTVTLLMNADTLVHVKTPIT